ncbi:MAG: type IV pilus twitching motility protein PilT [Erysipelotrichia bacterium]|nr:type IV pilus twitching motility protein PilT [Erysipelotrichia bacterium]NCC53912.1 type IV pilus twitching motility protein PilT [Erysipelotrichia bacterium]
MNVLDEILSYARQSDCSDVHLSKDQVILRRNGKLEPYFTQFSIDEIQQMIMDMLDETQKESLKQGNDLDYSYEDKQDRYRVNVYYERGYLCAALRIISDKIRTLEELKMPAVMNEMTKNPRGLVLITGPTGSGKSTTLAAMIDAINTTRNCHILTIEDPIEYVYQQKQAMIHQREIGRDVKDFDMALRSAMREDPDVILVGEMRDYETIAAVITLAETGHLVFSTLHTSGAIKTIDRIIDVFPSHRQEQVRVQLAGVINAVITQELLVKADQSGRVAAMEIMVANDAIRNLIRENKNHQIKSIMQMGANTGMQTMNASLASLVRSGQVSLDTALKYSDDERELRQYLGC